MRDDAHPKEVGDLVPCSSMSLATAKPAPAARLATIETVGERTSLGSQFGSKIG
jgi:hypothetical protein